MCGVGEAARRDKRHENLATDNIFMIMKHNKVIPSVFLRFMAHCEIIQEKGNRKPTGRWVALVLNYFQCTAKH